VSPVTANSATTPQTTPAQTTPASAAGRHAERPEPADRGATTIAEPAIERIATRVIAESSAGVGGTARRLLGVPIGQASAEREAEVTARLRGVSAVSLQVRCSVGYPSPVAEAITAMRGELTTRLAELTGLAVQRIEVTVTSLPTATTGARVR
jgi:uncharacterized alkaline shock family protein YloU